MKLNEAFPSIYLTKEDIGRGLLLTVRSVSLDDVGENEKKPVMSFLDHDKLFVVNRTNYKECIKIFETGESNDWINKKLVVYHKPDVEYRGEVVGGIRVRKPKQTGPAKAPSPPAETEGPDSDLSF